MQIETIEIKTSKEKFFQEYLILKKPVIDAMLSKIHNKKTVLTDIPLRVLAQLLYYNDNMKEHHLNIYISQLRALKILDGKKIRPVFIIYAEESRTLNFTFKLNGYS